MYTSKSMNYNYKNINTDISLASVIVRVTIFSVVPSPHSSYLQGPDREAPGPSAAPLQHPAPRPPPPTTRHPWRGLTSIHLPPFSVKRTQKGSDLEVTSRSSRFWPLTDSSTLHTQYWEPTGAGPAAGAPPPGMWAMGVGGGGGSSSWQSAGIGAGVREGVDVCHTI